LSPKPDCEVLSQALLKSRLYHQYNDCPSRVGNDAVTSFARVLSHFGDYDLPPDIHCETSSTYPFAKFSEEFSEFQTWQVNLCFINKINQNKKVCYPVLYDHIKGEKISLAETIKKLVYRLKGHSASSCKIITASEYKPELLKYKNGCHIIKDPMQCSGVKCTFKVMLNESEFTNYTSESKLAFNLFPVDFTNQNKSLKNIYQRAKQRTFKRIINVTSFINTFNQHKKSIFLGLGCAEEIYPAHFQRQALNQCSPLPFIVDGYFKDQDTYSLITRTSIDQIQAPRIIPWTQLFSALKHYQKLHPKNEWSFHAIY
ncbi:MAG: hypothetical protein HON90_17365, partial [Halobacteriovoraceae bacterium]|nr:hypothetical protein [Halobacteriovoraceae bacterium]